MRRRDALAFLATALASSRAPLAFSAPAREGPKKIGILSPTPGEYIAAEIVPRLYGALKPLGLVQGKDVTILWRSAEMVDTRLPALARDLVKDGVDLLSVDGSPATHAARAATSKIPIVTSVGDPQRSGFAASIVHPGGNVTGLSIATYDTYRRLVELLRAFNPRLAEVSFFHRPSSSAEIVEICTAAIRDSGIAARKVVVRSLPDVESAFIAIQKAGNAAALVSNYLDPVDPIAVIDVALRQRIAIACADHDWTAAGGLVSFNLFHRDELARRASFIAEILRGANPAELPFQLPDAYELAVNRTTAKKLGLEIPPEVLLRATQVVAQAGEGAAAAA